MAGGRVMRELIVRWKKATDDGFQRKRTIKADEMIERTTTPLEDAILGIHEWYQDSNLRTLTIQIPLDSTPTDEMIIAEIPKMVEEAKKKLADKEAKKAEDDAADEAKKAAKRIEANEMYEKVIRGDAPLSEFVGWNNHLNDLANFLPDDKREIIKKMEREAKYAKEAAEKATKEADIKRRHDEIVAWAEKFGSDVLKEQLAQGFDGVSRYLREKIDHDFGENMADLNNNGTDVDTEISNPDEDLLFKRRTIAKMLVENGSYKTMEEAFAGLWFQKMQFNTGEKEYYNDVYETLLYIVTDDYRPGEAFGKYSIRFLIQQDDD
jgi:hypothetical protein